MKRARWTRRRRSSRSWMAISLAGALLTIGSAAVSAASTPSRGLSQTSSSSRDTAGWPYPDHDSSNSRTAVDSPLTARNIRQLKTAWSVPVAGGLPTSPIIVGNSVYVEDQVGEVLDVNLRSGNVVWKSAAQGYLIGPEGVAVGWGKVFGVSPTSLFALNATTGKELWSTPLAHSAIEGVDVQPQVVGHEVVASTVPVSIKGGIYPGGARGYVSAVNEANGRPLWSFDTVDSPNLWGNPAVNSGGGAWYPPSFSLSSGLLYVGTANPAPFVGTANYPNGSSRPGPNLYTDSTVALKIANGKLVWYHQAHAHDLFDRDFVHTMIVRVPASRGKSATNVVVGTGKGGVVIGMNPSNGRQLWRTPVGIHHNDNLTSLSGATEVLPGTFGGVLTPPASAHGTVFVATLNAPDTLYPNQTEYFGGKTGTMPGEVVALNARSGRKIWDTQIAGDPTGGITLVNNLVLTATLQGSVIALSRSTGKIVWQIRAPGGVNGWMSVAGQTIVVPVGLSNPPTLWTLRLPEGQKRS
jgi:outer membrane protein assembly factor BamB